MFYWPSTTPDGEIYTHYHEGRRLDTSEAPALPVEVQPQKKKKGPVHNGKGMPGTDYLERGDRSALLVDHGWEKVGERGDNELWRRPGKNKGHSATWHTRKRLFYCFTSSTELDALKAYNLFMLYAEMEHGGDFSKAGKQLYADGYGDRLTPDSTSSDAKSTQEGPSKGNGKPENPEPLDFWWEPPAQFNQVTVPPFPSEALPGWLGAFVEEISEATQTPADLAAMISLSVLSAAARGRFDIEAPEGHKEPLNLYSLVALPPGERKSSVFSTLKQPLDEWEAEQIEVVAPEVGAEEMRQGVLEKRLEHLKGKAAKCKDQTERMGLMDEAADLAREVAAFKPCSAPRLLADDVTPEELVHLLSEHNGTMALLSAEGGIFDIISGLYSDGRANIDALLKAYDGESIRVDRRSRAPLHIPRSIITLGLSVQPSVIQGMAQNKKFRGRGLIGRFMFSLPESLVGFRKPTVPLSSMARVAYNRQVSSLLNIDCEPVVTLKCAPDALRAFQHYAAKLEPRLAPTTGDLGTITDWAGKLPGRLARIAGLIHLAEHGEGLVSLHTMERALLLGPYLIQHANAIFSLMGADAEVEKAEKVLGWMERNGEAIFNQRDCFNGLRGTFQKVDRLVPVLLLLENHGYIRRLEDKKNNKPGRKRSPRYEINPEWA